MAKSNARTNTDADTKADAGNAAGGAGLGSEAKKPAGLWGTDMTPADYAQKLPGFKDKKFPETEAGVAAYFAAAGAPKDLVDGWATGGNQGLDDGAVWASTQGQFKDAAGVESRAGDEGSKPAGKSGGKKQKPFQPMTQEQLSGLVRGLMENATAGGLPGGTLKGVEFKQTRDGIELRINNRGSDLEKSQVEGATAGAGPEQQSGRRGKKAKEEKPAPRQPMTMREQIDNAKQAYVDRTGMPAPWYTGTVERVKRYGPGVAAGVGATAVGVPAAVLLGAGSLAAGKAAYNYAFGGDEKKPANAAPQRAPVANPYLDPNVPMPGTSSPPPQQQIPAGTPAPNNTTLLDRMMRSREYA